MTPNHPKEYSGGISVRACWIWLLSIAIVHATSCSSSLFARDLKLLFMGDNGLHHPAERFHDLAPVLEARGVHLKYTERMDDLNGETLSTLDGLMLYANIDRIESSQAKAVLEFVASGKGFVPIHCASYCWRNDPEIGLAHDMWARGKASMLNLDESRVCRTATIPSQWRKFPKCEKIGLLHDLRLASKELTGLEARDRCHSILELSPTHHAKVAKTHWASPDLAAADLERCMQFLGNCLHLSGGRSFNKVKQFHLMGLCNSNVADSKNDNPSDLFKWFLYKIR